MKLKFYEITKKVKYLNKLNIITVIEKKTFLLPP